jgi:hypothetical protein
VGRPTLAVADVFRRYGDLYRDQAGCACQKVRLGADQQILTRDLNAVRAANSFARTRSGYAGGRSP